MESASELFKLISLRVFDVLLSIVNLKFAGLELIDVANVRSQTI